MGSKVGRDQSEQKSESDGPTDDVPKGQKLKPKWDILLERRSRTFKKEIKGAFWWGRRKPPSRR